MALGLFTRRLPVIRGIRGAWRAGLHFVAAGHSAAEGSDWGLVDELAVGMGGSGARQRRCRPGRDGSAAVYWACAGVTAR